MKNRFGWSDKKDVQLDSSVERKTGVILIPQALKLKPGDRVDELVGGSEDNDSLGEKKE
jgi:hypothetical protein